jgi:uncharacterized membrane protein
MLNYNYNKARFENFFDAAVAILLTILVLEIKIPVAAESLDTKHQVLKLIPSLTSYIASFLLIAGLWIDHHVLFLNIKKLNKRYILLNMLFILTLSLAPFATAFAGRHYDDPFAVALLGANYFVMNLFFGMLYLYASMKGLLPLEFYKERKAVAIYSNIGIAILLIAIPLAYVSTYISFAIYILIFTGHLVKKS